MARDIESLLGEMRNNPAGMRFVDVCKVATHFFGKPRQTGGSHMVWKMPWPGDPRINLQEGKGGKAKPYQIEQVLQAVDQLLSQRKG